MVNDRIGRADCSGYAGACLFVHMVGDNRRTSVDMEVMEGDSAWCNGTSCSLVLLFTQRYCKKYMEQGSKQTRSGLYIAALDSGAFLDGVARGGNCRTDDEFTVPGDLCAGPGYRCC